MSAPGSTQRRGSVQSVERALDLLEALGQGTPMGVSELVRATGLPLGTVHRLLATLGERSYVRQDGERKYAVGPAALHLADAGEQSLASAGRPFTARLTAITGETCNLAVQQGSEMVYISQSPSPHSLRIFAEVGRRVPMHSTAVGKAVLASLPWTEAERLLRMAGLTQATPHTITSLGRLREELERVRRMGYAIDEQERELGVRCVAAAVPGAGTLHAALSVSGPAERFPLPAVRQAAPALREAAAELAAELRRSG